MSPTFWGGANGSGWGRFQRWGSGGTSSWLWVRPAFSWGLSEMQMPRGCLSPSHYLSPSHHPSASLSVLPSLCVSLRPAISISASLMCGETRVHCMGSYHYGAGVVSRVFCYLTGPWELCRPPCRQDWTQLRAPSVPQARAGRGRARRAGREAWAAGSTCPRPTCGCLWPALPPGPLRQPSLLTRWFKP